MPVKQKPSVCVLCRHLDSRVDGLALASQSRALYYTDSRQNEIVVMSLDGKNRKVLRNQNLSSPRAIAVDERSGSVTATLLPFFLTANDDQ